jgi:sodium transport system permease protein
MSLRNVRLVYAKEIRDTLRDRRTLFISVVLPIFLYPLLMIGLSQFMAAGSSRIWDQAQKVAVVGVSAETAERVAARLSASEDKLEVVASESPENDLKSERIAAYVMLAPEFEKTLANGLQGSVTLNYDSAKDHSGAAEKKIRAVFAAWGEEILRERGLSEADILPVKVERDDAATTGQRGAKVAGPMLALLLVIMAATGAFYPAVDIMAGEKERGTMETLLVCPATRTEIVLGKYFTVLTMTLVTALLNFASMALTFSHMVHLMPKTGGGARMALTISPSVVLIITLALVPLGGLFAAVSLALSTFARSYKEGQHYLTPLFLAIMPLAMVAMIPGTRLESFVLVPVAGAVLLVRDLLLGTAAISQILTVLGVTGVLAGLAIWMTVRMFNREDVLFRDPGGADFSLFTRGRGKNALPKAGQAMGLALLAMTLIYFLPPLFMKSENGTAIAFFVQFLGIILGLPFAFVLLYKLDLKKTLSLKMPKPGAWPAALFGAPAVLTLVMVLMSYVGVDEKSLKPLEKAFEDLTSTVGLPILIILPPICEEIFFRGFLLSGLRQKGNVVTALILVSAIFAVFHFLPSKFLPTGLIGLWLGYLVVATGSLYPAILAHLVNNAIPFLVPEIEPNPYAALPALLVLGGVVWFLERLRRGTAPTRG